MEENEDNDVADQVEEVAELDLDEISNRLQDIRDELSHAKDRLKEAMEEAEQDIDRGLDTIDEITRDLAKVKAKL